MTEFTNFLNGSEAEELKGKVVLVTGGTGSFGSTFVKNLLENYDLKKLIIFSRDEDKQHNMEIRYRDHPSYDLLRFFIGDVRDQDRLQMAMRGVDYVIHAAALKHVPFAEYNPFECIRTNVNGAENIVTAAIRNGVAKVVALSTDKAVNPVNLYGASKLASDKIFVAANNLAAGDTLFSVVRYGNVVGSRGSVVPLFKRLIADGAKSLPITHPEMTRFWITVSQGVDFVLSSLNHMQGGEIYVPKIPSSRITDLASVMAPELPQEIVGIRPGEKLHEVMITEEDARRTLDLGERYVILPWFNEDLWSGYQTDEVKTVTEGFRYASDTNPDWLNNGAIGDYLSRLPS